MKFLWIVFLGLLPLIAQDGSKKAPPNEDKKIIEEAIKIGVDWVVAQQAKEGSFPSGYQSAGNHAMVLWTLLECGLDPDHKAVEKTLNHLRKKADPQKNQNHHGNYAASLTIVALQSYYYRKIAKDNKEIKSDKIFEAVKKALTKEDLNLVKKLLPYSRACATETGWRYSAAGKVDAKTTDSPEFKKINAFDGKDVKEEKIEKVKWTGDNSNAQYGWMGMHSASLLGVTLDDDDFITGEIKRIISTKLKASEKAKFKFKRSESNGFEAIWKEAEIKEEVVPCGWFYSPTWNSGKIQPTMSSGCVASLVYAWAQAEWRGLMTDSLRKQARETLFAGVAGLYGVKKQNFPGC